MIDTAVIMAAGRGTRMRQADADANLTQEQESAASAGAKGLMPFGRPFLEFIISALADAGITHVVIVTGPAPDPVQHHFTHNVKPKRVTIGFAVQPDPLGTADAVVRAAQVVEARFKRDRFLVLNSDNYYPQRAYSALISSSQAAVAAFDRDVLVERGNIAADRVRAFAVLDVAQDGNLRGVVEKPDQTVNINTPQARWVGMNLWAVDSVIVDACRRVPLSVRGEYELPQAVNLAITEGAAVKAFFIHEPVLDLSRRSDVAAVAEHLLHLSPSI